MSAAQPGAGMQAFLQTVVEMEQRVLVGQRDKLLEIAARMADTVQAGKRILLFGSGHSHLLAEEAFYRAGGLAAATPLFSPALMLHEDVHLSGRLERTPGVAESLLERYQPGAGEMLFVFSNSGVNHVPVALALEARRLGLFVVSVSSLAYADLAPLSALGQRLDQAADLAIDNGGVPGDAALPLADSPWRVGPTSTILGALIWNSLVVECLAALQARGWEAERLPVFASFNMPGADAHNQLLLAAWRPLNPHL